MQYTFKKLSEDINLTKYEVTVDFKELVPFQEQSYQVLSKGVKIQGFRPGQAPRKMIEERLGINLLNDALGRLLPNAAYEVIEKENKKPVSTPEYSVLKLDPKDGIVFTFQFTNYPEVKLGDFSKIKIKKEEVVVTEEDCDVVIKSIVRSSVPPERIKEITKIKEQKPKTQKTKEDNGMDPVAKDSAQSPIIEDFELNDDLVAELKYEKEKTLADIRAAVKERLVALKEQQNEEKYIGEVVEKAVELSKFEIPNVFIDNEVHAQEHDFMHRLEDLKLDADTYLQTQGTTLEKRKEEWTEAAKKRVSSDLVLINIAMQEDKLPEDKDIDSEIEKISDAKVRDSYQNENGRKYIHGMLTRQKGLELLLEKVEGKK